MSRLIAELDKLKNSPLKSKIDRKLKSFSALGKKPGEYWFSELCFCILTANSKARTGIAIQDELGIEGFKSSSFDMIRDCIIRNRHRFHNNKAGYIIEARKHADIKRRILQITREKGEKDAREWLVGNVKGLGYKEASHFLRNVGFRNLAILDRHILGLMARNRYISQKPKSLGRKRYLEIEKILGRIASKAGMSMAELDLYMWYMKTGMVLK